MAKVDISTATLVNKTYFRNEDITKPVIDLIVGDVTLTEGVDYTVAWTNPSDSHIWPPSRQWPFPSEPITLTSLSGSQYVEGTDDTRAIDILPIDLTKAVYRAADVTAQNPHLIVFSDPDISSGYYDWTDKTVTYVQPTVSIKPFYGTADEYTYTPSDAIAPKRYYYGDETSAKIRITRLDGDWRFYMLQSTTYSQKPFSGQSPDFNFRVNAMDLSGAVISMDVNSVTVTYAGRTLVEGTDYSMTRTAGQSSYTISISGLGDFEGTSKSQNFDYIDASTLSIANDNTVIIADGSAHSTPAPQVYYGEELLDVSTDYTYSSQSKSGVGSYTDTVTGQQRIRGTKDFNWSIVRDISGIELSDYPYEQGRMIFNGNDKTDWLDLFYDPTFNYYLRKGRDFTTDDVAIHAGINTVTLTGTDLYAGTVTLSVEVYPQEVDSTRVSLSRADALYTSLNVFEEGQIKINFDASRIILPDDCFDVSIDNFNRGRHSVEIIAKNDYTGTIDASLDIMTGVLAVRSKVDEFDFMGEVEDWYDVVALKYDEFGDEGVSDSSVELVEEVDYHLSATDHLYSQCDLNQISNNQAPAFVEMIGLGQFSPQDSSRFYGNTSVNLVDVGELIIDASAEIGTFDDPASYIVVDPINNYQPLHRIDYQSKSYDTSYPGPTTFILEGKGHCYGEVEISINVDKKDIANASIGLVPSSYTYNATAQYPEIINIPPFVQGVDFTLIEPENCVDASTVTATLIALPGSLYLKGSTEVQYDINPLNSQNIIYKKVNAGKFNNQQISPLPNPKYQETDYEITYPDSSNVGTYTATVHYKQTNIVGPDKTFEYTISPKDISSGQVYFSTEEYFTGQKVYPTVTDLTCDYILQKDRDFTVTSESIDIINCNRNVHFRVNGKGNYTGRSATKYYKILPVHVKDVDCSLIDASSYTFDGTAKRPAVSLDYNGYTPRADYDYELEYIHNVYGEATVRIIGQQHSQMSPGSQYHGNLTGVVEYHFDIARANFADCVITQDASVFTYDNYPHKSNFTVSIGSNRLTEGVDYVFTSKPDNQVNAGVYTYTIKPIEDRFYGDARSFTMTINKRTASASDLRLWPSLASSYTYNSRPQTPPVNYLTSTATGATVYANQDFSYEYSNNVYAGTASITVTFFETANFTGSVVYNFTINPLNISNTTLSSIPSPVLWTGSAARPPMKVSY